MLGQFAGTIKRIKKIYTEYTCSQNNLSNTNYIAPKA